MPLVATASRERIKADASLILVLQSRVDPSGATLRERITKEAKQTRYFRQTTCILSSSTKIITLHNICIRSDAVIKKKAFQIRGKSLRLTRFK